MDIGLCKTLRYILTVGWLVGSPFVDALEEESPIDLNPYVVSVSRYEESAFKSAASLSVVTHDRLMQDGVPSVVASLQTLPGVDIQQAGLDSYYVAVRGFNSSFNSNTYVMVDNRESFNPGLGLVAYNSLPIDVLDIERIEVVRGPSSALYGPGATSGVIHFITKNPFEYPGTSLSVGIGERSMYQASFRQAGVIKDRLGYKITGSYMEAEDWNYDPDDPLDAGFLNSINPNLRNRFGQVVRTYDGPDYDYYRLNLGGHLEYRFTDQVRLSAYVGFNQIKGLLSAPDGEMQLDGPGKLRGQLQFHAGGFYAQINGLTEYTDEDYWFIRPGMLMYGRSSQIDVQAKYKFDLWNGRESIIIGTDYKITNPKSKGTLYGRFEDDDQYSMYGGYIQSATEITEHLKLTVSGRIDYNDATGNSTFSPRLALVSEITPEHVLRISYNRGTARPTATSYYKDFPIGGGPGFLVYSFGSANGFTFPEPRLTSSFIRPGRDAGVGMANSRAYASLAESVANYMDSDNPTALKDYLVNKTGDISGFSEGILTFRDSNGLLERVVPDVQDIDPIKEPIFQTYELGYKGVIADKFVIGIDAHYNRIQDFLFAHIITPFVEIPSGILSQNIAASIQNSFSNEELLPFGIDVDELASVYANFASSLEDRPVGLIEPMQSYQQETPPEVLKSERNAGAIDYYGVDISLEAHFSDHWTAYANYSWFSENFFDDKALGLESTGLDLSMNTPMNKVKAGIIYRTNTGLSIQTAIRHVGKFKVTEMSYHSGFVEAYTLVDFSLTYDFSAKATGLNFSCTIQNVFDDRHREYLGVPEIGRLATARLSYSF